MVSSIYNIKKTDIILFNIKCFLLFFYIYNTPLSFLPSALTSIRLAVFASIFFSIAIIMIKYHSIVPFFRKGLWLKNYKQLIAIHVFLFVYILMLLIFIGRGKGQHMIDILGNMFFFSFFPIYTFILIFSNFDEFINSLLIVTIAQTVIVWFCLLDSSFASVIDTLFPIMEEQAKFRLEYAGGLGCIAAPGAFKYALGLVALFYKMLTKRNYKFLILYIIFSVTITMIARTGIFISLTGLILYILYTFDPKKILKFIFRALLCLILVLIVVAVIACVPEWSFFFKERFSRLTLMFDIGLKAAFFQHYYAGADTILPEISYKTIIGTGIVSGVSGNGVTINADGGFLKLYVGYGLIVSTLVHMWFFVVFYKMAKHVHCYKKKQTLFFFLIVILFGEFKEWLIYDMYIVCIFYVLTYLANQKFDVKTINRL